MTMDIERGIALYKKWRDGQFTDTDSTDDLDLWVWENMSGIFSVLRSADDLAQLTSDRTRFRALLVRCHDAITMEAIATEKFTEPPERCSAWWELRRTIAAELERSK